MESNSKTVGCGVISPSVSIVLPTLIRTDEQFSTTIKCIRRARSGTSVPFECVIVETETNYLEDYADVYINFPVKTNSTSDINAGFRACNTKYVGLLTNDVYVEDGWLETLLDTFAKKSDCGIATLASTQFNEHRCDKIEYGVWCSIFLTKNSLLLKHNYFDENFKCVWDDTDFLMKLAIDGYLPYKNHNCIAHHKIGLTEYKNPKHEELYVKNGLKFNEKYANCGHWLYDDLKLKV